MPALQLDIRTLLLIFSITYIMLAVVAVLIWRLNPAEMYTRDWALASLWGVGATLLFGLRDIAPDILSIVVGNALMFLEFGTMYVAIRRYLGSSPRSHWYWSPGAAAAVLFTLTTYAWPNPLARYELSSLGQAAFTLPLAIMLLRPSAPSLRLSQRLMAGVFVLAAAAGLARAAVSPWTETSRDFMQAGPVSAVYLVVEILAVTGLAVGWVVLVTNRLQLRLSQNEAEYRSVIEQIVDIFYRTDREGRLILLSPSAAMTLGYASADELLGQPAERLLHDPTQWARLLARAERGPVRDFEAVAKRKDGGQVPVSVSCHYYTDETGARLGLEGVVRDITERKLADEALRQEHAQLTRHVEARTAELRALNEELTHAVASRDEFLAAMSHELRTPLTAILGQAEMLRSELSGPLNERQLWEAQTIYQSGEHLLQLINDVLDMARLLSGRLELTPALFPLDELCQACLRPYRREAEKKSQTLHYTPAVEVRVLEVDGARLKQILVNLLSNAVKFTPQGGELGLEVQGDPARQVVRFTVWDTGIGVPAADLPRLFQHFVQLDSRLSRGYEGTGLGLALVKRLAELHGGGVEVESAPGRGSRFTVTLPWKGEQNGGNGGAREEGPRKKERLA